jgi:hypothetical protein
VRKIGRRLAPNGVGRAGIHRRRFGIFSDTDVDMGLWWPQSKGRSGMLRKRLITLASAVAVTGLVWGGSIAGAAGVANASVRANVVHPGGLIVRDHTAGNSGLPTISYNWSGYAATSSKPFTYVHSTFVQPKIACPGVANQVTSNWVGLDGFTDQTVEQDGTFASCGGTGNKTASYEAWYEMFPAGSVGVFAVKPGDKISVAVKYTGGKFVLTVDDLTSGKTATKTATCSQCTRSSAEWIIERPAECNSAETKCFLTELADFGTTKMTANTAQVKGGPVAGTGHFANIPVFMVDPLTSGGFESLDGISTLGVQQFTTTWYRSGTTTPITLGPVR